MSRAREFADLAGSADAGGLTGRNLIINGAMQVAQRGTSEAIDNTTVYVTDRTFFNSQATDQLAGTVSQSTEAPDGFSNSLRFEVTTAETALADDELVYLSQKIEAQNLQHLQYGSSSAKKTTLSFWVRSSLTGTFWVLNYLDDDVRSNSQSYTIDSANTWEHKTITFDGDTTGVIDNNNGTGLWFFWTLAAGANFNGTPHSGWGAYSATDDFSGPNQANFIAQTGNFYITGIQYEVGEKATPFEHRSYGDELHRCMRYFNTSGMVCATSAPDRYFTQIHLPVEMRASPTLSTAAVDSGSGAQVAPNWDRENNTTSRKSFYQGNPNTVVSSARFNFDAEL